MSNKIIVPTLGESITEATVSKWLKNQGDPVSSDEPIVELETDKVNVEVPSPSSGTLEKIIIKEGDTVKVGALLGSVSVSKKISSSPKEEKVYDPPIKKNIETNKKIPKIKESQPHKLVEQDYDEKKIFNDEPLILEKETESKIDKPLILDKLHIEEKIEKKAAAQDVQKIKRISPAARKLATDQNIDPNSLKGSGKNGIVLKEDVMNLMGLKPQPSERKIVHGPEERIKMTRLRITIAKRLKEAQENAAMLTTFNEVDMSEVITMRNNYKKDFLEKYSVKLGFMSFFVKSCVIGLKNYPAINAEIQGDEIVYKNYYNISFAVGTEKGLVVPVLRNADELSFAEIEKNIKTISEKARDGKLAIDDLQGGTFTISNGGVYGSMLSTPILNPPQSGVLGMHNIVERPIAINGEVEVRPVMYLALSYDHRIIDGKDSVSFLKLLKENLEDPRKLFLDL